MGNFVTINELLRDWPGEVIRLNMIRTHYRQPMDWTVKGLQESEGMLRRWQSSLDTESDGASDPDALDGKGGFPDEDFLPALLDDLNTPLAISMVHQMNPWHMRKALGLLGLERKLVDPRLAKIDATTVESRIAARIAARQPRTGGG